MSDKPVVLITGASRGIGAATALAFATAGYNVAIGYHSNPDKANEVAALCQEKGVATLLCGGDVSKAENCAAIVKSVIGTFGRLDVLVNNAGVTRDTLLLRMTEEQFDEVIAANLKSAFLLTKLAAGIMVKARRGRIINIASIAGVMGNAGQANYAASKAGVIGLTKTAARELGARGITVNAIAPGFIETDMTAVLSDGIKQAGVAQSALRRMGKPEEIASAAVWLASEGAGYMTGQVLVIDGGLY